jgi:hypothetical protein
LAIQQQAISLLLLKRNMVLPQKNIYYPYLRKKITSLYLPLRKRKNSCYERSFIG